MRSLGDMVRRLQPSLFWCMRGLNRAGREAVYTVFAFCQHMDNIVHGAMSKQTKTELLNAWREELDNIYDKKVPQTNIGRKIYKNCIRFDLPKSMWLQILDSAVLNVRHPLSAPKSEVFEKYISGAAVMPIHLVLMIVAPEHPRANQELAKNLGEAVAITYILRDIKDDAKKNRMYLPVEVLQKSGVVLGTSQEMLEDKNIIYARAEMANRVLSGYNKAERLLAKMNKKATLPLRFVLNTSRILFNEMNTRGWEIISPKPHLNVLRRLKILYFTLFK